MKVAVAETLMAPSEALAETSAELPSATTDERCHERMGSDLDANGKILDIVLELSECHSSIRGQNLPISCSQFDLGHAVFDEFLSQAEGI